MREPTPPVNVGLHDKITDETIPLDGMYMGRDKSGIHVWQYICPIPFNPGRHVMTCEMLPRRTSVKLMMVNGLDLPR